VDKTTAGQKGSGSLQDVEMKRMVGGIYGGGGGGGGGEKEREGKEDDDRLKHFWSIAQRSAGANCFFIFEALASIDENRFTYQVDINHAQSWPQSILFFQTLKPTFSKNLSSFPTPNINPPPPCPIPTSTPRSD